MLKNKMKDIKSYVIGFLTCACLFLIMGQTKSGGDATFDKITVDQLVVNKGILVTDGEGHRTVSIVPNAVTVINQKLETSAWIMATSIVLFTEAMKNKIVSIEMSDDGNGRMQIQNSLGNDVVYVGSTKKNKDGIIVLSDRYGENVWGATGEK